MQRYRPVVHEFEVPYVPEAFLSAVADAAKKGHLFDRARSVRVVPISREHKCLCVRVLDNEDVLTLRFDTLEIRTIDDHTLQLRVSYRGWLRSRLRDALDIGCWHVIVALFGALVVLLAIYVPESLACWTTAPRSDGDPSLKQARPAVQGIVKRLKEIAVSLPA